MTTHTPGPWRVDSSGVLGERDLFDIRGDGRTANICTARGADARLISAAPDLLAALVAICDATTLGDAADAIAAARPVLLTATNTNREDS